MYKTFVKIILYKKIIYSFIIYLILGFLLNTLTNYQFFTFFYDLGLSKIVNYIFKDNITFVGKHLNSADLNFYYIYLSFYFFLIGLYLINNSKKIIFNKNFLLNYDENRLFNRIFFSRYFSLCIKSFLELAIIRIHSSYIHYFSFLKICLISCFLGLGIDILCIQSIFS